MTPKTDTWFPNMPDAWPDLRLGALLEQVDDRASGDVPILSVSIHRGVSDRELADDEMERTVVRSEDRSKYKAVQPGDLVYNMMRAWQGGFGTVTVPGAISPAYVVARPKRPEQISSRFLELMLRTPAAIEELRRHSYGITDFRLRLYWESFKNIRVPVPSTGVQSTIVRYLDRETGRIDALVERLERLTGLLTEKRQAVISHAVTKGLNPDTPMKDSGIDWLGEVPTHWEVKRLRHIGQFKSGSGFPDEEQGLTEGDLPFYKVKDLSSVGPEGALADTDHYISKETARRLGATIFQPGSIVFAKVGAALLLNRFRRLSSDCCIDNNMMAFNLRAEIIRSEYAQLALSRIDFADLVNPGAVPSLNAKQVNDIPFALPPIEEQTAIYSHLSKELGEVEVGIQKMRKTISTLKERRSAVISAAVTGKIPIAEMTPDTQPEDAA